MPLAALNVCLLWASLAVAQVNTTLTTSVAAPRGAVLPPDAELAKREVSAATQALVVQLDSRDYAKRREAMQALREDDVSVDDLIALLARRSLPPEAQHRLVALVDERINTRYGALGVQMNTVGMNEEGVRIVGCVPGMPSERFLKAEDRVVAIDGRAVRNSAALTAIVQAMAPGTNVRVEVLRPEYEPNGRARKDKDGRPVFKRVEVTFPLGSGRDLVQASGPGVPNIQVSAERKELAREVLARFAPQPTMVVMPGEREDGRRYAVLDPDSHPDIQQLRRMREISQAERKALNASELQVFEATLTMLQRQSEDPTFPPAQREWLARVAKRYEELMPRPE